MVSKSIITSVDSYKTSHWVQYPPKTQYISSYIETRHGGEYDEVMFFGLQAFIKKYLTKPITQENIDYASKLFLKHGVPFNRVGWEHLLKKHKGYLPVRIEAVPEGTIVPLSNVLVQVVNTDPEFYWLTSWLETALMRAIWYPSTVATTSYKVKRKIWESLIKTSDNPAVAVNFMLHDFGARGASSEETAELGGMAHLVNFMGTDTVESLLAVEEFYPVSDPKFFPAFSIPATEHSTITSWGKDKEKEAYENFLDKFEASPIKACVSDSYDLWNAVSNIWGEELREKILNSKGTLVVRPDSGNPEKVPVEVIMRLATKFGVTKNSKGFKVLNPKVKVIQGDGCTKDTIVNILQNIMDNGYATDNIAFGMGGGLLQKCDRDTIRFAMKASAICIDNVWQDVYKDPITDVKKTSKKGRLALVRDGKSVKTVRLEEANGGNILEPVFENGKLIREYEFTEVRKNAESWMDDVKKELT